MTLFMAGVPGATRGVVLLHGRGGSARDMVGLVAPLGMEKWRITAPQADGNSWWPTSFLAPSAQMEPHVETGIDRIDAAIAALELPRQSIALVGFSQGACLALEYAARAGEGLGAVVGLSGGLVGTADDGEGPSQALYGHAGKRFDYGTSLGGTAALITCHEADPHIPIQRARASVDVFEGLGAEASIIEHPGAGHQPMQDGLDMARDLLSRAPG